MFIKLTGKTTQESVVIRVADVTKVYTNGDGTWVTSHAIVRNPFNPQKDTVLSSNMNVSETVDEVYIKLMERCP